MKRHFKIFLDFDKEERWLNQMAAEGWLMRQSGPFYSFTPMPPGAAIVRTDYRPTMSAEDFADYISLFADAGWHHLSGSRTSGTQYFSADRDAANDEIFSDAASKAQRYRRAFRARAALAVPFLAVVFVLWTTGNATFTALFAPEQWYQTPGIWQMQGGELLRALLIETPFVALRIGGPILLIAASLVLAIQAIYQLRLYERAASVPQTP